MPVVLTGSVTGTFSASGTLTSYVTTAGSVIASGSSGVSFTSTGGTDYILGGSIYAFGNGVNMSFSNASDNNSIVVERSGSIFADLNAMSLNGNTGDIVVQGSAIGQRNGIDVEGDGWVVSVSGHVEGLDVYGVTFDGDNATLNVTGSVTGVSRAVNVSGGFADIFNSGSIVASNTGSGIVMNGDFNTVVNQGSISGAIVSSGNSTRITNTGEIIGDATAVSVTGAQTTFINTGTVVASQAGGFGLSFNGASQSVKNSGEIFSNIFFLQGQSEITNDGLISGAIVFADNGGTITNTGQVAAISALGGIHDVANHGAVLGNVLLGDGSDVYRGRGTVDGVVSGEGGSDNLFGHDGNDTFGGGDQNDRLLGNKGDDTLDGGEGADILRGGQGNDILLGGAGGDDIMGGSGEDTIAGGNGADTINGGHGDDILSGNGARDTFVFNRNAGDDVITDFADGFDLVDLTDLGVSIFNFATLMPAALSEVSPTSIVIDFDALGGQGSVLIQGVNLANFDANDFAF